MKTELKVINIIVLEDEVVSISVPYGLNKEKFITCLDKAKSFVQEEKYGEK